jgi:hypothetical protein
MRSSLLPVDIDGKLKVRCAAEVWERRFLEYEPIARI